MGVHFAYLTLNQHIVGETYSRILVDIRNEVFGYLGQNDYMIEFKTMSETMKEVMSIAQRYLTVNHLLVLYCHLETGSHG